MGVDLGGLVARREVELGELAGQRVAIDAFNTLYQFLATIRQPDGTPLTDAEGRVTSHLSGLFQRTANLVEAGVRPVFVFDGVPHPLKRATLEARRRIKEAAQAAYEEAVAAGDLETARTKAQQTSVLAQDMVGQAKRLLDALGLPWVDAPSEGEAHAAAMARSGVADAVASQDFDCVLFGAPVLYRNLSMAGRRKLPGRQAWTAVSPERLDLAKTLQALGVTREQLVDVAILVGTDYNPGVKGVGPKTALKLVREHGALEDVLSVAASGKAGAMWERLRTGAEGVEPVGPLRRIFLEPTVGPVEAPLWRAADPGAVASMLVDEFGFSGGRVEATLAKYGAAAGGRAQRSLGEF